MLVGVMIGVNSFIGRTVTEIDFLLVLPPASVQIIFMDDSVGIVDSKSHSCKRRPLKTKVERDG